MKRIIFCVIALFCVAGNALAYDFHSIAPSGQKLYYNIVDGNAEVTWEVCTDGLYCESPLYYNHNGPSGNLIIPSTVSYNDITYTVTSIGNQAFYYCTGLTSVSIPSTVTSIGGSAFSECSGLMGTLTLPSSVTSIGGSAFKGCSNLTGTLTLPSSVTSIGGGAFRECSGLTGNLVIPSSVTSIGGYAFYGCAGLTGSLNLPNGITSIGDLAFCGCSGMTGTLTIPSSVVTIGNSAFSASGFTVVNFYATNCTSMGSTNECLGYNCPNLTTLNIGNNVINIPDNAFRECRYLTGTLVIPNSVTTIGAYAFNGCRGFTGTLVIPNSVTTIGAYAFNGCRGFTGTLVIPSTVSSIGRFALGFCSGLTAVDYNATNCAFSGSTYADSWFGGCSALTTINIGSNVTSIPTFAFKKCDSVTTINFNAVNCSMTGSGISFYGCFDSCHTLNIGENVTRIPAYAFKRCSGMTEIHSYSITPPNIDSTSFYSVSRDIPVYVPCGTAYSYASANEWATFSNFIEDGSVAFAVTSADDQMGTVQIIVAPSCTNNMAEVNAVANSGYYFDHWSDGSTDNPHTLTVESDMELIAYFSPISYCTITTETNDAAMGIVTGGGSYASGETATLTASAYNGYHFVYWHDGSTANPRTITVTGNATYTAYFEVNQPSSYTIFADCNNPIWGSVTGGGTYTMNSVITLNAIANNGYRFVHWQDGNTENPRTITVTGNATYIAYFEANPITSYYTISVLSSDPNMGAADGSGVYAAGSTATISATANEGYHFVQWQDGNIMNPRTITVTADAEYIAYFVADVTNEYTITVMSQNPTMGSTTGSGTFAYGTVTTITAEPYNGYHFVQWQDGNTQRIRTITVTGNATYTAYFDGSNGIDDVETADNIKIYTRGNTIVIDFSGQQVADSRQSVVVYDIMGRVIKQAAGSGQQAAVEIPVSAAGVYMVKVGEHPSRKVVVR